MQLRKTLGAAALVATAVVVSVGGCSGRDDDDDNEGPRDAGCIGACNDGGTTDGGTTDSGTTDAGSCPAPVNGMGPIGNLRANETRGLPVTLEGVVVTAVSQVSRGSKGDFIARFWVVNPCFPKEGIYVDKYYTDATTNYEPVVGDVLSIQGLLRRFKPDATDNAPNARDAYRPVIKSNFQIGDSTITGSLVITKTGTTTPPADNTDLPAGFGNADKGNAQPNPEYGGARVHIPGPLTIVDAKPTALKLRPEDADSGTYLGFEVEGGILVGNYKTFAACDARAVAQDGGTVTFPNGIRGVYETFTNLPCADGGVVTNADSGTSSFVCNKYGNGVIPGTENPYTYVVYPMNCEDMASDFDFDAGTSAQ